MEITRLASGSCDLLTAYGKTQSLRQPLSSFRSIADRVSISQEALEALHGSFTAVKEQEPSPMSTLMSESLGKLAELCKQGEYSAETEMLPSNYEKLKAIEAEIALGNDSQELQDRRTLLLLFGDVRELSEKDFQDGIELLNEFMPERTGEIPFADLLTALRKAYGIGDAEEGGTENGGEELSKEASLLVEALEDMLADSKGAHVEITMADRIKTTHITAGPDEDGAATLRFSFPSVVTNA